MNLTENCYFRFCLSLSHCVSLGLPLFHSLYCSAWLGYYMKKVMKRRRALAETQRADGFSFVFRLKYRLLFEAAIKTDVETVRKNEGEKDRE